MYDKRDDYNFQIENFPFLDEDVPRSPSYGVFISQLIRFARMCSNVDDVNNRNLFLTAKLLISILRKNHADGDKGLVTEINHFTSILSDLLKTFKKQSILFF